MIDYLFLLRGLVYAQSLLWIKLLDYNVDIKNKYIKISFPVSLGLLYLWVRQTGFSFNQYVNYLLLLYISFMLYSFFILWVFHNFYDAVCLTFLIVFINSYFWEFMLHFNAIIFYGISFNQITQLFHLVPAYLLYKKLEKDDENDIIKILLFGLFISTLNLLELNFVPNYVWINNNWFHLRRMVNNITRFICLNILLYVMLFETGKIKKRKR